MQMVEGYLLKNRNDTEILPTTTEEEMEPATGGMVFNPPNGLMDWIAVFDLKSLYPSSYITANISHETLTWDEEEADIIIPDIPLNDEHASGSRITEEDIVWELPQATGIDLSQEGVIPKYLANLFPERDYYKQKRNEYSPDEFQYDALDNQQSSVKILMNAHFGVTDNQYFRLSKEGFGDAITALSRYVAWKGMEVARDMGYEIVYSDTDSQFIQLAEEDEDVDVEEVVERSMKLESSINDKMDEVADDIGVPQKHPYLADKDLHGTDRQCFLWESEKIFGKYLQTGSKKRYAGRILWKEGNYIDDTDITGYEAVRSSSPEATSEFQEGMIQRILSSEEFEEVSEYVQTFADEIQNKSIKEMAMPGVLKKPPEEYPNRPVPRACEYSNEYLDMNWGEGDNPFVLFIKDNPHSLPRTNEIAVKWSDESVPDGFTIDYQKHIEKHMKQPMEDILKLTPWSFGELRTGKQTQSAFESGSDGSDPFGSYNDDKTPSNPFSD